MGCKKVLTGQGLTRPSLSIYIDIDIDIDIYVYIPTNTYLDIYTSRVNPKRSSPYELNILLPFPLLGEPSRVEGSPDIYIYIYVYIPIYNTSVYVYICVCMDVSGEPSAHSSP